jgi:hypothetical protein
MGITEASQTQIRLQHLETSGSTIDLTEEKKTACRAIKT